MKRSLVLVLTLFTLTANATHLRAGYISIERISGLTCEITVTVYTDSGSPVLFGGEQDYLMFGDGEFISVPETMGIPINGLNVNSASYTILHTFLEEKKYVIGYSESNRNEDIRNMFNSVHTPFYIETTIDLRAEAGFNASPSLLLEPVFQAKLGSDLSLSAGAVSLDDHTLLYRFGTPKRDRFASVDGYVLPENIHINPYNGSITWDTKFNAEYKLGEFTFTVLISLYREANGDFFHVSTMSYDMQIILEEHTPDVSFSTNSMLDENGRVFLPVNSAKTIKIFFEKLSATPPIELIDSSELKINEAAYSFSTYDSSNTNIKVAVLTLTSLPEINRENPYLITVRGNYGWLAKDVSLLFFTQDVPPKLIDFIELILNTHDEEHHTVEVYPNPTSDFVQILLPGNQVGVVSVYDASGRYVFSQTGNVIDIQELKRGLYFCTIRYGSTTKRAKFIKD